MFPELSCFAVMVIGEWSPSLYLDTQGFLSYFLPCPVEEWEWESSWAVAWQPAKVSSPQLLSQVTEINPQTNKSDFMQNETEFEAAPWNTFLQLRKTVRNQRTGSTFSLSFLQK